MKPGCTWCKAIQYQVHQNSDTIIIFKLYEREYHLLKEVKKTNSKLKSLIQKTLVIMASNPLVVHGYLKSREALCSPKDTQLICGKVRTRLQPTAQWSYLSSSLTTGHRGWVMRNMLVPFSLFSLYKSLCLIFNGVFFLSLNFNKNNENIIWLFNRKSIVIIITYVLYTKGHPFQAFS